MRALVKEARDLLVNYDGLSAPQALSGMEALNREVAERALTFSTWLAHEFPGRAAAAARELLRGAGRAAARGLAHVRPLAARLRVRGRSLWNVHARSGPAADRRLEGAGQA